MKYRSLMVIGLALVLGFTGCRTAYYSAMEKVGYHKRDLLKSAVVAARDDQKEAGEQFQDALTRLQEFYGFDGGNLEKAYRKLQSDFDRSESRATAVRERVAKVETIAEDLFLEWEKEIPQIGSQALQAKSRQQMIETRSRYQDLHLALKKAEKRMDPVIDQFRDQVLFLKHNLNAQAIASLKGEAMGIQNDIVSLIDDMNEAIAEANKFVEELK